jgi:glycosidase
LGQLLLGFCVRDTLNFQELDRSGLKSTRLVGGHECQLGLTELFAKYPEHAVFHQLNFITSHDTPRLLTLASGDVDGVLMIMTGFMTLPGAPCIYYGEEIGMSGGQDPDCRRGFEWDHQLWNQKIMSHTRRLAKLRHQEASLQEGLYQALYADEGVMVYRRHLAASDSVIGINTKHETVTILIQNLLFTGQGAPDGELWAEGTMTNGPLRLKRSTVGAGVDLTLELKARSSGVWCRPS